MTQLTDSLQQALRDAYEIAREHRHEFVTLEHLLVALTYEPDARDVLESCGLQLEELRADLMAWLQESMEVLDPAVFEAADGLTEVPQYTIGVQLVLQYAAGHVTSSGREFVKGSNVLVALFREEESYALYALASRNVDRLALVRYISHGIRAGEPDMEGSRGEAQEDGVDASATGADKEAELFDRLCVDLVAEAQAGRIDPLIGREDELQRLIHVLARRTKNNPILVGEAGVGKTAVIEGLAHAIAAKKVPDFLQDARIYQLNMAAVTAGTRYRGDFEERLQGVVRQLQARPNAILFVDEIHTVVGAGAASGGSLDAANILKPDLAAGRLRCIGTTTYKEYRTTIEKDHALARRFQKIDIPEPDQTDAWRILRGLKPVYEAHHGVRYSDTGLRQCVALASQHMTGRFLPDSAIDVMDEAGAAVRLRGREQVRVQDIEKTVARIARVPSQQVQAEDARVLAGLSDRLKQHVFAQDASVDAVAEAMQIARAGLGDPEKPIASFLFAGPTGVGKTELARQLAQDLGVAFVRFDMSEYMERHAVSRLLGAPPGYVGHDDGGQLTEAIRKQPHCVLLLDEIEKAHEDITNVLLQVMDYGRLTDSQGRKVDMRQVVLIMTSNVGARESAVPAIGFSPDGSADRQKSDLQRKQALEKTFSPEFRNRLTGVLVFDPLQPEIAERIVEKVVTRLESRLMEKGLTLTLDDDARRWLAEQGFDPTLGARPIERVVEQQLKKPLARIILGKDAARGARVRIHLDTTGTEIRLTLCEN